MHLCETVVARIDLYDTSPGVCVVSLLVFIHSLPRQFDPRRGKCHPAKPAHRRRAAGGKHVVVRGFLLVHPPHPLHVIAGVAPVALGVEGAEVGLFLQARLDAGRGPGDLARSEKPIRSNGPCQTKMFCDSVIVRPLSALQTLTDLLVIPTSNSLKQLGFLL